MQSRSIYFLLIVIALGALSGFFFTQSKTNYGLDVQGGVRLVYQMEVKPDQRQQIGTVRENTIRVMSRRSTGTLGVVEPSIVAKGTDQIVIELPGFTNIQNAIDTIGTSARIELYHAKTLVSPRSTFRQYRVAERGDADEPGVSFVRTIGTNPEEIKPGTAEYRKIIESWGEPILAGDDLANASMQQRTMGSYIPAMQFTQSGTAKMTDFMRRVSGQEEMIAFVLDGVVLNAAHIQRDAFITDSAIIDGQFSQAYVRRLVDLLNAGSLPVDLKLLSSQKVDPTIGSHALQQMILGGLISFGFIVLFLTVYYAFPGLIALFSLCLYVLFTITVLKLINATFSLASIAGFILSVGMAVDANILVFERFKEEMKSGKTLAQALNLGFKRALPAIIDSNACTILTSLVLANLGTGPVKGFATTLIIGVAISLFTAVVVTRSLLFFLINTKVGSNPKNYAVERNWFGESLEVTADQKPLPILSKTKRWLLISLVTILIGVPFMFIGGLKPNVEFRGGYEVQYALGENAPTPAQVRTSLERAGFAGTNVKTASLQQRPFEATLPTALTVVNAENDEAAKRLVADALGLEPTSISTLERAAGQPVRVTGILEATTATGETLQADLRSAGFADATVTVSPEQTIQTLFITLPPSPQLDGQATSAATAMIAERAGLQGSRLLAYTNIGPAVQQETVRNAVLGVVLSLGLICIYLGFRFGIALGRFNLGLRFGLAALGAVMHDVLVVLGLAAVTGFLLGWEISALFLTAMLTVIGFSVHDTIVIFDRIRENLRKPLPNEDFENLVNRSVTQSIARSINTSGTVIVTLIILIAIGTATPDLKFFCAAMLFGIVSGTYSSIYNASPLLWLYEKWIERTKGFENTLLGVARAETVRARVTATRTVEETQAEDAAKKASSYGQVRRRASAVKSSQRSVDDEEI